MKARSFEMSTDMNYLYIMASSKHGVIYLGSTSNLRRRVKQHKLGKEGSFTKQYLLAKLVYFETHPLTADAQRRERQIKEWKREWKIQLIETKNPEWRDLSQQTGFIGRSAP